MTNRFAAFLIAAFIASCSITSPAFGAQISGHVTDPSGDSRDGMANDDLVGANVSFDATTGDWTVTTELEQAPGYDNRSRLTALLWRRDPGDGSCTPPDTSTLIARFVSDTAPPGTGPGSSKADWTVFEPGSGATRGSGSDGTKSIEDDGRSVVLHLQSDLLASEGPACATVQLGLNAQKDHLDRPVVLATPSAAPRPVVRPLIVPSLQNNRILTRDSRFRVRVRLQRLPEPVTASFELRRTTRGGGQVLGRITRRLPARIATSTTILLNATGRRHLRQAAGRLPARLVVSFVSGSRKARRAVAVTVRSAPRSAR